MNRSRYGFSTDPWRNEWDAVKDAVRSILEERASRPDNFLISYSEPVVELKTNLRRRAASDPLLLSEDLLDKVEQTLKSDAHPLHDMLGEISSESTSASPDRGMLSVIVVHKDGGQMPGRGFFQLAKSLRRLARSASAEDKERFWVFELNTVRHSYGTSKSNLV
jgi:hypothetical protein